MKIITIPSSLKGDEKVIANYFLENVFDNIRNNGINGLKDNQEEMFTLPDRFYKQNRVEKDTVLSVKSQFVGFLK